MEAILKRRSVRRYADKDVPEECVHKILEAAMSAPSAGNEQPWHFIVIRDKKTLAALAEASPYAKMLKGAPLGILVVGDLSLQRHEGYWALDCAAAVENMLIAVTDLGLGAVWLGIYPLEERVSYIKNYFKLPEHIIPFAVIPVGYPLEAQKSFSRFHAERIHYEAW